MFEKMFKYENTLQGWFSGSSIEKFCDKLDCSLFPLKKVILTTLLINLIYHTYHNFFYIYVIHNKGPHWGRAGIRALSWCWPWLWQWWSEPQIFISFVKVVPLQIYTSYRASSRVNYSKRNTFDRSWNSWDKAFKLYFEFMFQEGNKFSGFSVKIHFQCKGNTRAQFWKLDTHSVIKFTNFLLDWNYIKWE